MYPFEVRILNYPVLSSPKAQSGFDSLFIAPGSYHLIFTLDI